MRIYLIDWKAYELRMITLYIETFVTNGFELYFKHDSYALNWYN